MKSTAETEDTEPMKPQKNTDERRTNAGHRKTQANTERLRATEKHRRTQND